MKILFLNDCNGHEYSNPLATLVVFAVAKGRTTEEDFCTSLRKLEFCQLGVTRRGGDLAELLSDVQKIGIATKITKQGRKSEMGKYAGVHQYKLISGNY